MTSKCTVLCYIVVVAIKAIIFNPPKIFFLVAKMEDLINFNYLVFEPNANY